MKLTTFKLDVTPPIGSRLAYSINNGVDSPIFIRGVLLDDGTTRAVIVSCDYIYIWGQAWLNWRQCIAAAADTEEEYVFLHSVHQHDSMGITTHVELDTSCFLLCDADYCEGTLKKLEKVVRQAAHGEWKVATKLMTAERRMCGLASNRRILDENGKCYTMRYSMCDNAEWRALPTGSIDPLLRTIAFANEEKRPLVALHFYASHPMAAYGRGLVSADVPGVALDYAGTETFNLYLTGCAGNVTFGKYFTGNKEESLRLLGRRLGQGIVSNLEHLEEKPLETLSFAKVDFPFPFNLQTDGTQDLLHTAKAIIARDLQKWQTCTIQRLSFSESVHILSFPSEPCVEYQLYAQSLVPEQFVACAAYGNGIYFYIPTEKMFKEGGYEPSASVTTPKIEKIFKHAIKHLLPIH